MNQRDNETSKQPESVTLPKDEVQRLRNLSAYHEFEDKLEIWAKKQFRIPLIAVSVFSFVGIQAVGYVLVEQMLRPKIGEATSAIQEATVASLFMKKVAEQIESDAASAKMRAKEAFENAQEQRREVTTILSDLRNQANAINQRFDTLLAKSEAVSESVRAATSVDIDGLQDQINAIAAAVDQYHLAGQPSSDVSPNQVKIKQQTIAIKKQTDERRVSFQNNSKYSIGLNYLANRGEDARLVMERMRKLGFEMRNLGSGGLPSSQPEGRNAISILIERHGKTFITSPNNEKNNHIRTSLSELFPDWNVTETTEEQYGSNSTDIVFWGLNIILL